MDNQHWKAEMELEQFCRILQENSQNALGKGNEDVCQALLEIMEPEINKIVGEATERVRTETMSLEKELVYTKDI